MTILTQYAQAEKSMLVDNKVKLICYTFSTCFLFAGFSFAEQLSPPPYNIQNRHQVNIASGHVSPVLEDVSIGGSMGLTHSISTYASNFVSNGTGGADGYNDKFRGGLYKRRHHERSTIIAEELYVLTAYDDSSSTDFLINADGETFTSLGDTRYTLEFVNNPEYKPGFMGFVYTKPDGTALFYPTLTSAHDFRPINNYISTGMNEIRYPNGFTVTITHKSNGQWAPIASVRTNTGFQLKYVYVANNIPAYSPDTPTLPAAASLNWSDILPKYLWAINNAVDYCSPEKNDFLLPSSQACPAFTKQWPTVTYEWPNGMPRAMYLGPGVFKVTDAKGGVTEFRHTPHNTYLQNVQNNPNIFVPRLTSIKSADSNVATINYEYENKGFSGGDNGGLFPSYIAGPVGQLKRSWIGNDTVGYTIGASGQYAGFSTNGGGGYQSIAVSMHAIYGIYKIEAWNQKVELQMGYANRVYRIEKKLGGGVIELGYDARGNLTTRTENGMTTNAEYPTSCTTSTRKICNQATWIRDAKGNQTDYTYHAESGQVATVTLPANRHGIRAQTRYKYEQKYAKYFISPGNKATSSSPIWLKTEESYCVNSATTSEGHCTGNDRVVTSFEYIHDNLLMTGMAVYSQKDNKTLRSCYQYDTYGNRVGKTQPKANLASC